MKPVVGYLTDYLDVSTGQRLLTEVFGWTIVGDQYDDLTIDDLRTAAKEAGNYKAVVTSRSLIEELTESLAARENEVLAESYGSPRRNHEPR